MKQEPRLQIEPVVWFLPSEQRLSVGAARHPIVDRQNEGIQDSESVRMIQHDMGGLLPQGNGVKKADIRRRLLSQTLKPAKSREINPLGMRKLSNSDCDEMKDYDFARITAINEDYYGR